MSCCVPIDTYPVLGPVGATGPTGPAVTGSLTQVLFESYPLLITTAGGLPKIGSVTGILEISTTIANGIIPTVLTPADMNGILMSNVFVIPRNATLVSFSSILSLDNVSASPTTGTVFSASLYANTPANPATCTLQGTYSYPVVPVPLLSGDITSQNTSVSLSYPAGTAIFFLITGSVVGSTTELGTSVYVTFTYLFA